MRRGDEWRAWVCCHPLDRRGPGGPDVDPARHQPRRARVDLGAARCSPVAPDAWDARGARVTAVSSEDPLTVLYDGRATAEANWFETTGLARERGRHAWCRSGTRPIATSPWSDHALRYASAVPLPDGRTRFYFEAAREDGAHDLRTDRRLTPVAVRGLRLGWRWRPRGHGRVSGSMAEDRLAARLRGRR